jgi:flagella basal body P-ring formation protein FlgA
MTAVERPLLRALLPACLAAALAIASACPALAQDFGVIPTRVIYPGETIAAGDLKMARVRKGKPATIAFAAEPEQLVGKIAKRTLLPGRFVPLQWVREAWLIKQGATVQVVFTEGNLMISATAITLEPGSPGDVVKVRNADSGAIFPATVMADGTVRVGRS